MIVADRIAVMNEGRVVQVARPAEIYERPNSRWVADFIGEVTLIEGAFDEPGPCARRSARSGSTPTAPPAAIRFGSPCVRKRSVSSNERPQDGGVNAVAGTVHEIGYRGGMSIYKVRMADRSLMKVALANTGGPPPFAVNDLVWLSWPIAAGVVLTR